MGYKSLYSDRQNISANQYICELVCKNRSMNTNTDLPFNFWNIPIWNQYYVFQIVCANRILKIYPDKESSLIKFIRTKKIWSLSPKWIIVSFEEFLKEEEKVSKKFERIEVIDNPTFKQNKEINIDFLD